MDDKNKTIAASDLHNCAAVLYMHAGKAEKRGHHARAERLMRGFEFLSDLAGREYDTVTVPRELLREVLEAAEEDSRHSQLYAGTWANASMYEEDRDRIAELRRIAGLEESDGGKR